MTNEKFQKELETLKSFYELYCWDKHKDQKPKNFSLIYKEQTHPIKLLLCEDCLKNISYSFDRLQECSHEIKPRCRNCPNPCYEKEQWKQAARVMKYSALKLGLSKVKQKLKKLFTS